MPYNVTATPRFQRDSKAYKNNKPARALIQSEIAKVVENPYIGRPYVGNLSTLMKHSFGDRPAYRLIYRLYKCCDARFEGGACVQPDSILPPDCQGLVDLIHIKTREECNNLYKLGKGYFDATFKEGFDLMTE